MALDEFTYQVNFSDCYNQPPAFSCLFFFFLWVRLMMVFPILATEHHTNAGYSEHLEKKLTEKAESQIIMTPEEQGVAEGSVKHQDTHKAGEKNQITSKAALLASVLGQRLVNSAIYSLG